MSDQNTTQPPKNAVGEKSKTVTGRKSSSNTVYTLPDGTPVAIQTATHRKRKYTPRARRCASCGNEFKPETKHARFCSQACRSKAYRQRIAKAKANQPRQVVVENIECAHCGQGFFAVQGKGARYCSNSCRVQASKARRLATVEALMLDTGIDETTALDALDSAGLKTMTSYLTKRGYEYQEPLRQWIRLLAAAGD